MIKEKSFRTKRIICIVIAFTLVFALIPTSGIFASAATQSNTTTVENSVTKDISDNYQDESQEVSAQFTWNNKRYEKWGENYWYQMGALNHKNSYFQIGCVATYRIPYYKLSDSKESKCDDYAKAINHYNYYNDLALIALGATEIGTIVAIVATLSAVAIPVIAVGIIILAMGCGIYAAVSNIIKGYYAYNDVKDYYEIIKGYGTKL